MASLQIRFGQFLAAQRKRRGLKQGELAEQSGLSIDTITKLETGAMGASFRSIQMLADALKIDPAELFTYELGGRPFNRPAMTDLISKISGLSDPELRWLNDIVEAALRPRA